MPKKIGTTLVPRNPVARSPLLKKGGAHQTTQTSDRRRDRQSLNRQMEDWREELAFERSLKDESAVDPILLCNINKLAYMVYNS